MSRLVEVNSRKEQFYLAGYEYISRLGPSAFNLRSCYEGFSFQHLAQCINFDKTGQLFPLKEYLFRPKCLIFTERKEINGVCVICKMPEFGIELDFETYVILNTDTPKDYMEFLENLSSRENLEIATFSQEQSNIVNRRFPKSHIHYWSVFQVLSKNLLTVPVNLLEKEDVSLINDLNDKFSIEISPYRSLKFQLDGFPYRTYKVNGVLICIRQFSSYIWVVHYFAELKKNPPGFTADALCQVSSLLDKEGITLIWRLRKKEIRNYKGMLLKTDRFTQIANESHYHIRKKL